MRNIILAVGLATLAACTQGPPVEQKLGVREAERLDKLLAGKVPGEPVRCISSFNASQLQVLGDNVLVYRVSKKLLYRNNLEGGCNGLAQGDTLVMNRVIASQYCRGDIARVVDLRNNITRGSCSLGDFIPYRPAEK